jgi:uncharacterized protein
MNTTTKKNKLPLRRCLVTGESLPKAQLLRLVRTPESELIIDVTGKANGRGAYIQKDLALIERLEKQKLLERQFRMKVDPLFYDMIKKALRE